MVNNLQPNFQLHDHLFVIHDSKLNIFGYCTVGQIKQAIINIIVDIIVGNSNRIFLSFADIDKTVEKISGKLNDEEIIINCDLESSTLKKGVKAGPLCRKVKPPPLCMKTLQCRPLNFIYTEHLTINDSIQEITTYRILLYHNSNTQVHQIL